MRVFTTSSRWAWIFGLCLLVSFSLQAQVTKIKGHIHYEDGQRVANATIVLGDALRNASMVTVTSDSNGEFEVEVPQGSSINKATVTKAGESFTQTLLGYVSREGFDGKEIKIKVVRPGHFVGNVKGNNNAAVKDVTVKIQSGSVKGTARTDNDGDFFVKLPKGKKVTASLKITIDGYEIPSSSYRVNLPAQTVDITYEKPSGTQFELGNRPKASTFRPNQKEPVELIYNIFLVDTNGSRIPNTPIVIANMQHLSDSNGVILYRVRGEIPTTKEFVPKQGMKMKDVTRFDDRKEIHVELVEQFEVKDLELPLNKDSYRSQLESIAVGLEKEQLALNARGMELRREIAQLAAKLSQERDLKQDEKEDISSALALLESTLEENDREYQRSQLRTQELLEKMRHDLDLVAERNKQIEEKARQQMIIFLLVTASLIGLTLIFYFISDKMRRQRNELEATRAMLEDKVEEVRVKNEQILSQTDKLKALNHTISSKSRKITDSISYAQSIQTAILPSSELMSSGLKDHFILYQSKEIVSGDFYWYSKGNDSHGKPVTLIAAIDCTGHGVPGGFMSMIAHTLLSELINHKGMMNPQEIMQELNAGMRASLQQDTRLIQDGMDIILCALSEADDKGKVSLEFSAARRPLIYITPDSTEAVHLKGDRRSIGGVHAANADLEFSKQQLLVPQGTCLYLTSDGYVEQGTQKTGKIGTKRMLETLVAHAQEPMNKQKEALEQLLSQYQVGQKQRDDILIFGVRV